MYFLSQIFYYLSRVLSSHRLVTAKQQYDTLSQARDETSGVRLSPVFVWNLPQFSFEFARLNYKLVSNSCLQWCAACNFVPASPAFLFRNLIVQENVHTYVKSIQYFNLPSLVEVEQTYTFVAWVVNGWLKWWRIWWTKERMRVKTTWLNNIVFTIQFLLVSRFRIISPKNKPI